MMAVAVKIVATVNELDADNVWTSAEWILLNEMNIMQTTKFNFTMANMLQYFIHQKATDGNPPNDFKDVNTKAYPLFKAGHIQPVYFQVISDIVLFKCTCLAEMKKDVAYKLRVATHSKNISAQSPRDTSE